MKKTLTVVLAALFMFSITVAQDKPAGKDKSAKTAHHETKKGKKDGCGDEKGCCQHMKESKQKSSDDDASTKNESDSPEKK